MLRSLNRSVWLSMGFVALLLAGAGRAAAQEPATDRSSLTIQPDGQVEAMAYSPDGKRIAVGTGNNVVIYDAAIGQQLATWAGHQSQVESVAFSPDGRLLASSGGQDGIVIVRDAAAGTPLATLQVGQYVVVSANVAFSPDGKVLAAGYGDATVRLWDPATGQQLAVLQGQPYPVSDVAFSPDGKMLAASGTTGKLSFWSLPNGQLLATVQGPLERSGGRADAVRLAAVALSPDGRTFATQNDNSVAWSATQVTEQSVYLWDLHAGQPRATMRGHANNGKSMAFSPDGKLLALASEEGPPDNVRHVLRLYDVAAGRDLGSVGSQQSTIELVAFSPDGKSLLSSDGSTIKVWPAAADATPAQDAVKLPAPVSAEGHQGAVYAVTFSPDGKTAASGSEDGTVKLWDIATGRVRSTFNVVQDAIHGVAFSPDGKTLATADAESKSVKLWDVATGKQIASLEGHRQDVLSVAFSPDGKLIASGSRDLTARLWDAATGRPLAVLGGQTSPVTFVAFSPDGTTLAVPSAWTINLHDTATGQLRAVLRGHRDYVTSATFGPDGRTLISASQDSNLPVLLWDTTTGRVLGTLRADLQEVTAVALSPDGKILATGGTRLQNGTPHTEVTLWDVSTGSELAPLSWHTQQVTSLAFSPDGKTLASASYDRTVKFWDLARYLGQ